jgi:hypothetical protein
MIKVETTDAAVHVTIPKDEIPSDRLNAFLNGLRLESIARRSNLSEREAEIMADQIKAGWWTANKHRFVKPAQ